MKSQEWRQSRTVTLCDWQFLRCPVLRFSPSYFWQNSRGCTAKSVHCAACKRIVFGDSGGGFQKVVTMSIHQACHQSALWEVSCNLYCFNFGHFHLGVPQNFAGLRSAVTHKLFPVSSDIFFSFVSSFVYSVSPSHPLIPSLPSLSLSLSPAICSVCPDVCMSTHEKPSGSNRLLPLRLQHVVCPLHIPL